MPVPSNSLGAWTMVNTGLSGWSSSMCSSTRSDPANTVSQSWRKAARTLPPPPARTPDQADHASRRLRHVLQDQGGGHERSDQGGPGTAKGPPKRKREIQARAEGDDRAARPAPPPREQRPRKVGGRPGQVPAHQLPVPGQSPADPVPIEHPGGGPSR